MRKIITEAQVIQALNDLEDAYPEAGCALHYENHFQLICAVMLSAQTTDVSVNKITPKLFKTFPDAKSMAVADSDVLEEIIRPIGLYKNKSRSLRGMSKALSEQYGGVVPGDYDALVQLPGVGRKTANVVLAEGCGVQRIAVDTHVFRVSNRMGLASADNVLETEQQLMKRIPEDRWTRTHHLLIFHGRNCCRARRPECEKCPVSNICLERISVE